MKALAALRTQAAQLTRDKADTLLLLASALLVLAPHAGHLPPWVSLLCAVTLLWRAVITLRGLRMPPAVILLPLSLAAMAGIWMSFRTLLGRDAGVAMLVLLVAFKMLEMHARRDLFVVLYLCFFLVLTNFFYSQSIGTALMMVGAVVALLTTQLTFQFTGAVPPLRRRLWMGARIALLALPLTVLLFFVFPRLQGPLWGMPGDANGGKTGLSDTMSPGNISDLAQSDEPAFRVKFAERTPAQSQLYWRGLVLAVFDGRSWTQLPRSRRGQPAPLALTVRGNAVRQEITLEPSNNRWLFALDLPVELPALEANPVRLSPEFELTAAYPISQRVRYQALSHLSYAVQAEGELDHATQWLALPGEVNPRARALAATLRNLPQAQERVNSVLGMFRRDQYIYTLEPPPLGQHSVDEFLFETRAGFCEHYASAFVFLMRAAGVPARVITGYQGGEENPFDGYLTVRQSDAHAWAEVWLAGRGWVRVDPTAAVAPERVQRNLARALPRRSPFGEAIGELMDFERDRSSLLAQLRYRLGALNNGWNQWVLNYTPERQRGVVDALQEQLFQWRTLAIAALAALLLALWRARSVRRQIDPIDALYSALCAQLGQLGLPRAIDEGPSAYAQRVGASSLPPAKKTAVQRFLHLYSAHTYANRSAPGLAATLKSLLTESR